MSARSLACGHSDCSISSGICEELTFGRGTLDRNGYWEIPCYPCAASFKQRNPDMAKEYGVWPEKEENNLQRKERLKREDFEARVEGRPTLRVTLADLLRHRLDRQGGT
jgi:hypothetical protein